MKLACFLKVRQKLTGSRLSKSRYSTNFEARFCKKGKIACKLFLQLKEEIFRFPVFWRESASILEQTSRSYGGLKLGLFVTKWGLFVQFQRVPFGKSTQILLVIDKMYDEGQKNPYFNFNANVGLNNGFLELWCYFITGLPLRNY